MYVGSSINLCSRISGYLNFSNLHGIIGDALRRYGLNGFILIIFLFPNATRSLVLAMEQSVLDGCVCAYNILPTAGSPAGAKRSEEHKAKISCSLLREKNPRFNKGKSVYLYIVRPQGLELIATFPNRDRASEHLGIARTTLFNYIKAHTLFKINDLPHIASYDANLT